MMLPLVGCEMFFVRETSTVTSLHESPDVSVGAFACTLPLVDCSSRWACG